ncbi:uncharacterized protein [Neodiprion pinetum]|uniref:uncharacterized protein isoform X1 n=1 Tax=Neodiprion pinetum TaxID=441929 RepID=UPI00371015C1
MGFVFTRAGVLCIRHSRSTRRGNESNGAVIRSPGDYKSHMNKNGIYGGEAELAAAADIFKICLIMYREEQIHPHRIGSQNETQLSLLFTGDGDSGHFDVLQNQNKIQISKGQPGFTMTMEKGEVSSSRQGDEDGGWSEVSQKKEENKIVSAKNQISHRIISIKYSYNQVRGRPGSMLTTRVRGVLRNEQQRKYTEKNNIKKVILENNRQSVSKNNSTKGVEELEESIVIIDLENKSRGRPTNVMDIEEQKIRR